MSSSGGPDPISLQVRTMATGNHDVQVPAQGTVADLKRVLVRPTGLPLERQRIIYGGRVLEDDQALSAAGVCSGHTLHLVEQDPAQQRQREREQQPGTPMDPSQIFQAMFGGLNVGGSGSGGEGVPSGPGEVHAHVLGPFNFSNPASWQQVQQQMAAALGGMAVPWGAPSGPQAAAGTGSAAAAAAGSAGGGASPFNFGNLFAQAAGSHGGRDGNRNGRHGGNGNGGRGQGQGQGQAAQGAAVMQGWWDAMQQLVPHQHEEGRAHLFDGLEALLTELESGDSRGGNGTDGLPAIRHITPGLEGVPAQQRPAWRRSLANWQRNFVAAARAVLETAQLSGSTRAAINRVLQAAGADPLRLSATGGSSAMERRVRSFPVLDSEDDEAAVQPAAVQQAVQGAAGRTAAGEGAARQAPLPLAGEGSEASEGRSAGDSESEWEEMGDEERAAVEAAGVGAEALQDDDGRVEDYVSSEGEEGQDSDDLPSLMSSANSDEEEPEDGSTEQRRNGGSAARPGVAAPHQHQQPAMLPQADMLLLGAVAVGELTRRFLLLLGAPAVAPTTPASGSSGGQPAAVAAAVERLRQLTAVPRVPGPARDAVVADVRLLAAHMSRVSAAAGELMRGLQYLGSGMEHRNVYLTRVQPGYVSLQGGVARVSLPRPQRMHMIPTAAVVDIAMGSDPASGGQGGAGGPASWQQMLGGMLGPLMGAHMGGGAAAAAAAGGRGRGQGHGQAHSGGSGGSGSGGAQRRGSVGRQPATGEQAAMVRIQLQGPGGQPVMAAVPVGQPVGGDGSAAAAEEGGEMPEDMAGMAQLLLGRLGVDPAAQQQLLLQFGGIMRALRQTSVASLDVPAITSEVAAAVRRVVSQQAEPLRATLRTAATPGSRVEGSAGTGTGTEAAPAADALQQEATAFAQRVGPAVAGEVQRVLGAHLNSLRNSPAVAAFAPYLEQLGIDLSDVPESAQQAEAEAEAGAQTANQGGEGDGAEAAAIGAAAASAPVAPVPEVAAAAAAAQTGAARQRQQPPGQGDAALDKRASAPGLASSPAQEPEQEPAGSAPPGGMPTDGNNAASSSIGRAAPAGLGKGFLLPRKPAAKRPAAQAAQPSSSAAAVGQASGSAPPAASSTRAAAAAPHVVASSTEQPPTPAATGAAAPTPVGGTSNLLAALASQLSSGSSSSPPAGTPTGTAAPVTGSSSSVSSATNAAPTAESSIATRRGGGGGGGSGHELLDLGSLLGGAGAPGSGGSGGGGLMGMIQGMMSNPAVMEMAQSPAMQRMAEQMFSGSGGNTGGGGGLAGMMNAVAPMMGELLGGTAGGRTGARGRAATQPSASLEDALAAALPAEDAERWRETIQADEEKQRQELPSSGGVREPGEPPRAAFSDAYLAALPPKAAAGLLRLVDDDDEEEAVEEGIQEDGDSQQAQRQRLVGAP